MTKKYSKSKSFKNATGPGFRTADNFRARSFGKALSPKFNPAQFRTQHKGG